MMATLTTKPRCILLEIAAEIRNQIYSEVFSQPSKNDLEQTSLPALLLTCRKINTEATKLSYSSTTHTFVAPGNGKRVRSPIHYELNPKIRYVTAELRDKLMASAASTDNSESSDNMKSGHTAESTDSTNNTDNTNSTNPTAKVTLTDFFQNAASALSALRSNFKIEQIEVPWPARERLWRDTSDWSWKAIEGQIEWALVIGDADVEELERLEQLLTLERAGEMLAEYREQWRSRRNGVGGSVD